MITEYTPMTGEILARTIRRLLDEITLEDLDAAGIDTDDSEFVLSAVVPRENSTHLIRASLPGKGRFEITVRQI